MSKTPYTLKVNITEDMAEKIEYLRELDSTSMNHFVLNALRLWVMNKRGNQWIINSSKNIPDDTND
jgi:hypothetical protein